MAKTPTLAPVTLLFADMATAVEDPGIPDSIDEIVVRVAAYYPEPSYQCTVRFKDRTHPWASWVSVDPYEALQRAMVIALRGRKACTSESTAMFHKDKEPAMNVGTRLVQDNANILVTSSAELVPYKGWVAVVFHKKGVDETDLIGFAGQAEVREVEDTEQPPAPNKNRRKVNPLAPAPLEDPAKKVTLPPRKGKRKTSTPDLAEARAEGMEPKSAAPAPKKSPAAKAPEDEGDMRTWKKSRLIKYHQEQFGKQPNNKLSVDEIVDMIEAKLAERG